MDYLELFIARSTQGHHGDGRSAPRVATDGLVAAAFEHRSSRADDPPLHAHVVIANLIRRADGQWTALDSAALYHHMLTAGYIYQAVLRGELTRRLVVDWTCVKRGVAEITGIPKGLCRAFSQRRQAIEARLAARGETGRIAAQQACLDTRPAKPDTPRPLSESVAVNALWTLASTPSNSRRHPRSRDRSRSTPTASSRLAPNTGTGWHLRSPNVLRVIGPPDDVEAELLSAASASVPEA